LSLALIWIWFESMKIQNATSGIQIGSSSKNV
jgi:hypothetical protein